MIPFAAVAGTVFIDVVRVVAIVDGLIGVGESFGAGIGAGVGGSCGASDDGDSGAGSMGTGSLVGGGVGAPILGNKPSGMANPRLLNSASTCLRAWLIESTTLGAAPAAR